MRFTLSDDQQEIKRTAHDLLANRSTMAKVRAAAEAGAYDDALTRASPWSYELLRARGNSIEGGTTEILQNILAERVLGLPRR